MANIAYVRVSTIDQNEARQTEALSEHRIDKWFIEKVSAKDNNRQQLQAMMEYAREGDAIHIHDFSRLARNASDLLSIIEQMENKGITLKSNKENIDTSTPTGKLMVTLIGAINQFERENLLERQREGIAIAKAQGKYKGKQAKKADKVFEEFYQQYIKREIKTKKELAQKLMISRPTLDRMMKDYEKRG